MSDTLTLGSEATFEGTVIIDSGVGINTLFLFSGKDVENNITIELKNPSGKVVNNNAIYHLVSKAFVFNIPDAQVIIILAIISRCYWQKSMP